MLDRNRDWEAEMPPAARSAFIYAQFSPCPIIGFTDEGLAILDLQAGDSGLGGKFNDIRVEPEHLNMIIHLPQRGEGLPAVDDSQFPIIEGFRLDFEEASPGCGMNIVMRDVAGKYLAGFIFHNAEKMVPTHGAPHFPLGPANWPYSDGDQGWDLRIWESGGFVYVVEGRGEPDSDTFDVHFRVPLGVYLSGWKRLGDEAAGTKEVFDNLDDALARPEAVRILNLADRRMPELPEALDRFVNLEELNLMSCRLNSLPDSLGGLKKLRKLDLRFNRLTSLPASFAELERLETVWLMENRLASIPDFIAGMKSLKSFIVNYNPIPRNLVEELKSARPDLEVDPGMREGDWPPPQAPQSR